MSFIQFELDGEKRDKRELPKPILMTAEKSKTGAVLRSLLKDCTYPGDYETLKNKWKVNPKLYEEEMKKLSAKIGVKLQILYDKWGCEMISIEKKTLETSNSLEMVDKEVENTYKILKTNIALCKKLEKVFFLRDPL